MALTDLGIHVQQNKQCLHFTPSKNQLKMCWILKCNTSNCRTTRRKHRGKSSLTSIQMMTFWGTSLKPHATKSKINDWAYIRLKICSAKDAVDKMKRWPMECEKNVCKVHNWCGVNFQNKYNGKKRNREPNFKVHWGTE